MGRLPERAALFRLALHREPSPRLLFEPRRRGAPDQPRFPRVLRSFDDSPARARRRHGRPADGHGHGLRLPQVPKGPRHREERQILSGEEHVRAILRTIGEDPDREGLLKTPERVARALEFLTKGYQEDPSVILNSALFSEEYSE